MEQLTQPQHSATIPGNPEAAPKITIPASLQRAGFESEFQQIISALKKPSVKLDADPELVEYISELSDTPTQVEPMPKEASINKNDKAVHTDSAITYKLYEGLCGFQKANGKIVSDKPHIALRDILESNTPTPDFKDVLQVLKKLKMISVRGKTHRLTKKAFDQIELFEEYPDEIPEQPDTVTRRKSMIKIIDTIRDEAQFYESSPKKDGEPWLMPLYKSESVTPFLSTIVGIEEGNLRKRIALGMACYDYFETKTVVVREHTDSKSGEGHNQSDTAETPQTTKEDVLIVNIRVTDKAIEDADRFHRRRLKEKELPPSEDKVEMIDEMATDIKQLSRKIGVTAIADAIDRRQGKKHYAEMSIKEFNHEVHNTVVILDTLRRAVRTIRSGPASRRPNGQSDSQRKLMLAA